MWCWNLKKFNEIFLPLFLKRDRPALKIKEMLRQTNRTVQKLYLLYLPNFRGPERWSGESRGGCPGRGSQ